MYPSKKFHGYGSFVRNICQGLQENGIDITCKAVIRGRFESKFIKLFIYTVLYLKIIFYFFFRKYDFLYVHYPIQTIPILNILYKIKTPRIFVNYHGEDLMYNPNGYTGYIGRLTEKFCRKYATGIVVPSNYFRDIVKNRNIISNDKIIVSPSGGINSDFFFPPTDLTDNNNELRLGYVGRIEVDKGILVFLELCDRLKKKGISISSVVIGNGKYYQEALNYINSHNLSSEITMINGLPQKELGDFYRQMDLFIFVSSRSGESLGLTGIEAMACGVPIIGSSIGGITSYLKNDVNGWLVSPSNNANQIDNIIDNYIQLSSNEKEAIRKNCVITGKNYYHNKVCKILAEEMIHLCEFQNKFRK